MAEGQVRASPGTLSLAIDQKSFHPKDFPPKTVTEEASLGSGHMTVTRIKTKGELGCGSVVEHLSACTRPGFHPWQENRGEQSIPQLEMSALVSWLGSGSRGCTKMTALG